MDFTGLIKTYNPLEFEQKALELYQLHTQNNPIYRDYLKHVDRLNYPVRRMEDITFLPIGFFKTHDIILNGYQPIQLFFSSGTTSQTRSKHHIVSTDLYIESFTKGFECFFGPIDDFTILALLPSYLEQGNSSLVYMVENFINKSKYKESGFYLYDFEGLIDTLQKAENNHQKTLLIGVSYALLDLIEHQRMGEVHSKGGLKNTIIMETGGMKGRRKELIKSELHELLKNGFGVSKIYSEYGMTELLSQAYSLGNLRYQTPPWMKVFIREIEDPYNYLSNGKTGGINIIDFANYYSCPFIETQDLGKIHKDGTFEILGRFDHSDIRGCNLMIS